MQMNMKKSLTAVIIFLSLALSVYAQDARQRTVETIVADALAAMPAQNSADFNSQIGDLAAAAPASVVEIAKMMKPAAAGVKNNLYEYALSGLSSYASANPSSAAKISEGFSAAIEAVSDKTNKAFLMMQLLPLATTSDAPLFQKLAGDSFLAPTAVSALVDIPGTEDILLGMIKDGKTDKGLLAAAAAKKGLSSAEPYLQNWAASSTGYELNAVCDALGKVGSESSLKILKDKYVPAYADLAVSLADGFKSKAVASAAKVLMQSEISAYKSAGAEALMKNDPSTALKTVSSALKSEDGQYRDAVIDDATELLGSDKLVALFTKGYAKFSEGAKLDVLNWFGNYKVSAASDIVSSAFNEGGSIAQTAIAAAGKIGGKNLGQALVDQLGSSDLYASSAALAALKAFEGDIDEDVVSALGTAQNKEALMKLASSRRITKAAPAMFNLLENGDASAASYLAGVVGNDDTQAIGKLLGSATDNVPALQDALYSSIHTLTPDQQYSSVCDLIKDSSAPQNFYNVLAKTGTDQAVADLAKSYSEGSGSVKSSALEGLLNINNFKAASILLNASKNDASIISKTLPRYVSLVNSYENDLDKKKVDLGQALDLADTKALKTSTLNILGKVPTMKAFLLAGKYLDDKDASYAAANAVKNIASKTKEEINYADLKANLEKAQAIFKATGDADDGYAVDEISKMLGEAEPSPVSELTAEEKKQGFEMLFDGTNLDKWQGDKEGYIPVNGAIYVSANYGSTGNLYTNKEYRNFVYRFEFCFLREGVNNGVGVRTPMGVDAAYNGMCEVQILDHDAPMYANLREYQVHGSVYGVIPAKRIVHKPLGEWSTEEIRVEGNHIKVTVNGEVIVDGDVSKACKGHNVAPDGGKENPYTVDHKNHPGMFNKTGYISFCGHGEGLKLRNVRVLDLGDKK